MKNIKELIGLNNKSDKSSMENLIDIMMDSDVYSRIMLLQLVDKVLVYKDRCIKIFYRFSNHNERSNS
jgi:hypothetical protein